MKNDRLEIGVYFGVVAMPVVSVQFIEGLEEEISGVSLRKNRFSAKKTVVLMFKQVQALEKGRSFTNKIENLWLRDEEGTIQVYPNGVKFVFVDDDNLSAAECSFDVEGEEVFARVMRFLHRYAEVHGFSFQES